jgi:hypothetical protein
MKPHYRISFGSGSPAWRGWLRAWLLWLGCLSVGCAGVVLDERPPGGFDLSGTWLLDPLSSEQTPEVRRLRARGMSIAMVAQDFSVLHCRRMEIEQNVDSMGVAYDGGSYRDVSWGVRERGLWEVNAGWDDGALRILSKARDAKAEEHMMLTDAGKRLTVRVSIDADGDQLVITRMFVRQQ